MKDVIEELKRQPVLIDFWAPWCGPCKQLTPILEKVVKAAKGEVKLVKMNIDDHPAIPGQMGIQSIPAVIAFVNGQPADGFMGALPEGQINAFIERVTKGKAGGNETQELMKSAEAALAEGDSQGAVEIYEHILGEDAANIPALAGLARCHVAANNIEKAKQILDPGAGGQAQRRRRGRRARRHRGRRAGERGRAARRARAEGRGQSARPSGALRSRGGAQRGEQARGGGRAV